MPLGDNGPSVLLVEDDQDGRRMYAEWLIGAGFTVHEAHNGLQALERAFDSPPDVVVTTSAAFEMSAVAPVAGSVPRTR